MTQPVETRPITTKVAAVTESGIQIHVPWQKPEYPMPIDRFPKRADGTAITAADFKVGEVLTFHLAKGNKKKPKAGGEYDGSKDFHFYWNLTKVERPKPTDGPQTPLAVPLAQELPSHPASVKPAPVQATPRVYDAQAVEARKEDATNRRTALMQAVAAAPHLTTEKPWTPEDERVAILAQRFYEILLTLHVPEPEAK